MVINPGCLIPRRRGETASVYLLREDASAVAVSLDASLDRWADEEEEVEDAAASEDMDAFLDELRELDADSLDFEQAVKRYCDVYEVSDLTRQMIVESMEERR